MPKKSLFIVMFCISIAFTNCNNGSTASSDSIYKVTGPSEASASQGTYAPQSVTLQTDAPGGGPDPSIEFKSGILPSYVSLDSESGELTIINADWTGTLYYINITFWTENSSGTKSDEFILKLNLTTS